MRRRARHPFLLFLAVALTGCASAGHLEASMGRPAPLPVLRFGVDTFAVTAAGQERVVLETMAEIQAGRPVQLLVTNFPIVELNHTVIVYDYRVYEGRFLELRVYDPNDPSKPGSIAFDRVARRFFASEVFDTNPGDIRAFRMYHTPLL